MWHESTIWLFSYAILIPLTKSWCLFAENIIYTVLERFKDNKLLLNYVFNIVKTSFNLLQNIEGSESFMMTLFAKN
jgi:hypothetical protein